MQHKFIFQSGLWIGEGKITFSTSPEHLHFYTKWTISVSDKISLCQQKVETQGSSDLIINDFSVTTASPSSFTIEFKNSHVGSIRGQGIIDDKTIAWEFRGSDQIEGFEVYERQENGDYMVHAEYSSTDKFRTIVDGRIWEKTLS